MALLKLAKLFAALAVAAGIASAHAQSAFPNKPVRLLVPFPPGGSTTAVARLVGDKLAERWGHPVVIDAKPGANGILASSELVRARPDGYTLLFDVNQHAINPFVVRNLPYDTVKDFQPVAAAYRFELILVANPSVSANNLGEFVSLAKSSPGTLNYATADTGGLTHLAAAAFSVTAGIRMQQVAYKGSAAALMDVLGGQVQIYFSSPPAAMPYVNAGKLKALAWTGKSRSRQYPNVPTFAEAGLPGLDASSWGGFFAPAGTPPDIVNKIAADVAAVLAMPDIKEKMAALSVEPFVAGPAEFSALIKADLAKYSRVVKEANLKIE